MEKEPEQRESLNKAEQETSLANTKEDRLAIAMILELSSRFGLSQPHEVASILKVPPAEAQRLLTLAKLPPDKCNESPEIHGDDHEATATLPGHPCSRNL